MSYQKVYINQVSSTSTMDYLTQMWKEQLLCDAVIKTGNIITKAHRLVLIAACPMLQNMENASLGSHLEVRMASDIKQESVNALLQYIYEGYMMLTEDNCKDIEKMAKLLQVESVVKCCADFYKCLSAKTGVNHSSPRFNFQHNADFHHVKISCIQKTVTENALKRGTSLVRPEHSQKRPRYYEGMVHSSHTASQLYGEDPEQRQRTKVPKVQEDMIEIIHNEPAERDSEGWPKMSSLPPVPRAQSISVASKARTETNIQVVHIPDDDEDGHELNYTNVSQKENLRPQHSYRSDASNQGLQPSQRGDTSSHPQSNQTSASMAIMPIHDTVAMSMDDSSQRNKTNPISDNFLPFPSNVSGTDSCVVSRPYAAGSESQVAESSSAADIVNTISKDLTMPLKSKFNENQTTQLIEQFHSEDVGSHQGQAFPPISQGQISPSGQGQSTSESNADVTKGEQNIAQLLSSEFSPQIKSSTSSTIADMNIVKVENADTGALELSVDTSQEILDDDIDEDMSNEDSNISGDHTWHGHYIPQELEGTGQGHGQNDVPQTLSEPLQSQMTTCSICCVQLQDAQSLIRHRQNYHPNVTFCYCGMHLESLNAMVSHVKIWHPNSKQCPVCRKDFQLYSSMKRHFSVTHIDVARFQCHICQNRYKRRDVMLEHLRNIHSIYKDAKILNMS